MVQIGTSQCLFNREFPEFFKTHQHFSLGEILRPLGAKNLPASLSVVGCIYTYLQKCLEPEIFDSVRSSKSVNHHLSVCPSITLSDKSRALVHRLVYLVPSNFKRQERCIKYLLDVEDIGYAPCVLGEGSQWKRILSNKCCC